MRIKHITLVIGLLMLALVITPQFSQAEDSQPISSRDYQTAGTCTQLVRQAFFELSSNCAGQAGNTACYGFNEAARAVFGHEEQPFSILGETLDLTDVASIRTAPLNATTNTFGVVKLNIQTSAAQYPVTVLMFGAATLENAVEPEQAFIPTLLNVSTTQATDLQIAPGKDAVPVASIENGTALDADAVTADGQWVRVYYKGQIAWADANAISTIEGLAVIRKDSMAPFQAFNIQTGANVTDCTDAPPPVLLIQNPNHTPVNLVINGTPVEISSTIFVRTIANTLRLTTGEGNAVLYPDAQRVSVPLGISTEINAAGNWQNWSIMTNEINQYGVFDDLPSNVLVEPYTNPTIMQPSGVGFPTPIIIPPGRTPPPPFDFPNPPVTYGTPGRDLDRVPWKAITIGAAVCPDWILFHSDRDLDWDIYRLDRNEINISKGNGSNDIQPSYSIDAEWIAYTSDRNRDGVWEIYVADKEGEEQLRVTYNTGVDVNPVWGPKSVIAFETNRDGNWELYTFDVSVNGAIDVRITEDPANDINPFWSPEGDLLYFQSDRDDDWEIYVLELATGDITQLTDNDTEDQNVVVSHDGTFMVWLQLNEKGVYDLWWMDLESGETEQLTDLGVNVVGHHISPDDTFVAFAALDGQDYDVYVIDIETKRIKNLTQITEQGLAEADEYDDYAPNFRCDSPNVLFHSNNTADRNREIFEVNPLPIIGASNRPFQLTNRVDANNVYPLGDPREEINSREGQVPRHPSR